MLHWFHHLRNHQRISAGKTRNNFPYGAKFYYGTLLELNLWGLKKFNVKEEEIATILRIPDYNNVMYQNLMPLEMFPMEDDGMSFQVQINGRNQYIPNYGRYLNGCDLSENAYRCSKTETGVGHLYMRFGHSSKRNMTPVSMNPIPNRFQLAHRIATDCYLNITGKPVTLQWDLIQRQAIK